MGIGGEGRRARLRICLVVTGAIALAAGGASAAAKPSSHAAAKKSPIIFATAEGLNTQFGSWPGIPAALRAGAAAVNKTGGINGHKVEIINCNTQFLATPELACARQMAASKAVAVIGDLNSIASFTTYGQILANANLADVANTGPEPNGFEGTKTFPVTWPLGTFLPCVSHAFAKLAGGNKVAMVVTQSPTIASLIPVWSNMIKAEGLNLVKTVQVPQTASDFSSYVGDVQQSGANVVLMGLAPGAQSFVAASGAVNAKYSVCTALGLEGQGTFTGPETNRLYIGADFQPLTSKVPGIKEFLAQMSAEKAKGDSGASTAPGFLQGNTMEAWLGFQVAVKAASQIKGAVTRTSMLSALRKVKVSFGGVIPPVNYAVHPQNGNGSSVPFLSAFQHVWSSPAYLWKWQPNKHSYALEATYTGTFLESALAKK